MEEQKSKKSILSVLGIIVVLIILCGILVVTYQKVLAPEETVAPTTTETKQPVIPPATKAPVKKTTTTAKKTTTPLPPPPPPASTVTSSSITTINYTGKAFVPATVTVKAGKGIRFVNMSTINMQITSDPNATLGLNAEFNQTNTVGKGGTYAFSVLKKGTWHYHNAYGPQFSGTVIVE